MPVLSRRIRSRTARRKPGGPAPAVAVAAVAALLGWGCLASQTIPASGPPPTAPAAIPSANPSARPLPTASGPSTAAPESGAPASATALADLQPDPRSLAAFTVVCERWGGEPALPAIQCGDAVSLALAAIGAERAASVRRLDFGFDPECDGAASCAEGRPDVGWVVAIAATFDTLRVRVGLDEAGELRAWPPLRGPTHGPPAFRAPPILAPDIGPGLPAELRDRQPVPFCGSEDLTEPDAFDVTARTCFLDGILAGVPVELVSRSFSTEGHALLTLYRFAGRGAILAYIRTADGWTGTACGISPIATSAVFLLAGTCERRTL